MSGAVQTYNWPETDLVIKKLISLKLQVIANILSNSNTDL